jgi:hypothetical protein
VHSIKYSLCKSHYYKLKRKMKKDEGEKILKILQMVYKQEPDCDK